MGIIFQHHVTHYIIFSNWISVRISKISTEPGFETTYEAFLNSVHSDDRMLVQDAINKAVYENKPYSIDYRILLPDGSER
ncbi:PAS domain-containing protein, partial [Methanococcoides seepicolus]|nr:PAS domain-containing protein [Methanococcoides seepicolus]